MDLFYGHFQFEDKNTQVPMLKMLQQKVPYLINGPGLENHSKFTNYSIIV